MAQFALGSKLATQLSTIEGLASMFPRSVEQVKSVAESAKTDATSALTKILDESTPSSFQDVCCATDAARAQFSIRTSSLAVIKSTHPEKEVRDAATEALTELSAFSIDNFGSNRALFKKFESVQQSGNLAQFEEEVKKNAANADAKSKLYFYEEALKDWKRQGLALPDEKLEEAKSLKKKISDVCIAFDRNVAEYKKELTFTLDELKGVPQAALDSLKKPEGEDNKRICGLDYPTYFAIMKNCEVANTRKQMARAFEQRAAPENIQLLKEFIVKYHEFANLVGYKTFAALDYDSKMAKNTETVTKFIQDLIPPLQQKWAEEKKHLLADLPPSVQLTEDGKIPAWDITFLMTQYSKKHLQVDETKISEYFPVSSTIEGLMSVFSQLFGVEMVRKSNFSGEQKFWHDEVEVVEVHNQPRNQENPKESLLGLMILDLHPREGKYGHACVHSAVPAVPADEESSKRAADSDVFTNPKSNWSPPVAVMICNFPKGTAEKPGLLQHSDVVTFFHEAFHGFHTLFSRTAMASAAGTRVLRDFVECPSQAGENWMWETEILAKFAKHYETGAVIDPALMEAKIKSRNFFSGRDMLRQMTFATYSKDLLDAPFAAQKIEDLDTTKLFDDIRQRILPDLEYDQEGRFEAAFSHIPGGYGASYVGYSWSLVLSDDVFEYVKTHSGLQDPAMGKRIIDCILKPGGSVHPNECMENFLGRPANNKAFFKHLGIKI